MRLLALIKKEFLRFFRDPRLVLTMLLPGLVIFLVYSIMGEVIWNENTDYSFHVSVVGNSECLNEIETIVTTTGGKIEYKFDAEIEEESEKVENCEITALIVFSDNFDEQVSSFVGGIPSARVEIIYNSADTESSAFFAVANSVLNNYHKQFILSVQSSSSEGETVLSTMASILPFIVVALIFSSCMGVTLESIAGEKERGTLATILVTPVKRFHMALGKILPLSCIALIGAFSSFIGIILSYPKLVGMNVGAMLGTYGAGSIFLLLFLILSIVPVIVSIITIVSTFAKSVKEASAYTSIIMIFVFVLSLISVFAGSIGEWIVVVPILNTVVCMQSVLSMSVTVWQAIVSVIVNIAFTALLAYLTSRMLSSEKIMFGK